jgi:hypothetical protein
MRRGVTRRAGIEATRKAGRGKGRYLLLPEVVEA